MNATENNRDMDEISETEEWENSDELPSDAIYVPVEDLGKGLFNLLGDAVGGIVSFGQSTSVSLKEGMEKMKGKFSSTGQNEDPDEQDSGKM